ncbi:unnamed protein product [Meloidogyne enterolobii]|uniref:Uncharacterized protein n=1 Tax=Meloidogyne enterolobii TaxID=390850 RepID=A0ACB1AQ33_MELEN
MHSTTPQNNHLNKNKINFFSSFLCNYPSTTTKSSMEINKNLNKNNKIISSFYSSPKTLIPQNSDNKNNNSPPSSENTLNNNSSETPLQKDNVILTVRMLMQGKDVGSIIGKKGDFIRQIRENSGAKINITDGIVTISGTFVAIDQAFTLIDIPSTQAGAIKPPITLRLIIPASQCGSLIGKGGSKIREIRDKTGASLQVANEMLSNSTEKPVTISGNSEALIGCMKHVCHILLDSPAKGPTIQYKPVGTLTNILTPSTSVLASVVASGGGGKLLLGGAPQQQSTQQPTLPLIGGLPPSLWQQQLLLQQLQQQQTQRNIISNNMPLLIPQSLQEVNFFETFLASTLNPTLVPNSIPNLQHIEAQSSTSGIPGFDPVIAALLAQQGTSSIDYASILAAQKQQSLLSDPSTINLQHQQQMLLQQQHLNNLLLYQQQQSQLQTTTASPNTTNTPTTARSENTENSDF